MTLIEALLLLPEQGEPELVNRAVARALAGSSPTIVGRHGRLWSLTDAGRRFLAQFRHCRPYIVTHVTVSLVVEDGEPVFHLLCDGSMLLKVGRTDLQSSLRELQSVNPGMSVVFDFRNSGRVP